MIRPSLVRVGGLAAMVGGVVYAGVGLVAERLVEYLYYMGNIDDNFVAVLLPIGAMVRRQGVPAPQPHSRYPRQARQRRERGAGRGHSQRRKDLRRARRLPQGVATA